MQELEVQSRKDSIQQRVNEGSWTSYESSAASSTQHQHQNGFMNEMHKVSLKFS